MNARSIKEVVGLINEARKPGDTVTLSIGSASEPDCLSIANAPSYVLDAITDNGYYLSAVYGSVVVTEKEN